jgi:molecular chaperone GrpE
LHREFAIMPRFFSSPYRELLKLRRRHFRAGALEASAEDLAPGAHECCGGHGHDAPCDGHGHHHHAAHAGAPAALAEAEKTIEKFKEQLLRQQAEFENTRRRLQREQSQQFEFANQKLIEGLLPVLDNFDRALANPGDSVQTLLSGIQMVQKQLADLLAQNGLTKVESLGQIFDPNKHEAVSMTAAAEGQQENEIVNVLQEGYLLKQRLIRPAMVQVAK